MTVTGGVLLAGNSTGGAGGGIYNSGWATITGSTLRGNYATDIGGGINNGGGTLIVLSDTLSDNGTGEGVSGAVCIESGVAEIRICAPFNGNGPDGVDGPYQDWGGNTGL